MEPSPTDLAAHGDQHVVVFDVETRKLAQDVGGWDALRRGEGGLACMVVWDNRTGLPHIYDAHTLQWGIHHIEGADVVLSFNGIEFDVPFLEGVSGRKLVIPVHLDLLQLVWQAIQGRKKGNTLDELSKRTLGQGKISKGTCAPVLADEGRWAELINYCIYDVDLTRRLFRFVQNERGVISAENTLMPLRVPYWFGELKLGSMPEGT
jgi:DEAD/DEAH box helicase domain-containing protein